MTTPTIATAVTGTGLPRANIPKAPPLADPDINTGRVEPALDRVQVSIDWLGYTVRTSTPARIREALAPLVAGDWRQSASGYRGGYSRRINGPEGAVIAYWPTGEHRDPDEVFVELPGKWCRAAGQAAIASVLTVIRDGGGRPTRIDLAGDDHRRVADVRDLVTCLRAGRFRSRSRPRLEILALDGPGHEVVIGSSQSNEQLVVYDKAAESGVIGSGIRWELRTRHDAAVATLDQLLLLGAAQAWRSRLVSFIDLFDDKGNRATWFTELVLTAPRISRLARRTGSTLESRIIQATHLVTMFMAIEQSIPGYMASYCRAIEERVATFARNRFREPK